MPIWYGNAQFIAYCLDTRPEPTHYYGRKNQLKDVTSRSRMMQMAAEVARGYANPSSNCLKVFVAPEFYFRGRSGAYGMEDFHVLLEDLRRWAKDPKWAHWVFFFGTVVVSFVNEDDKTEILNMAIVHVGGDSSTESTRIVRKEAIAPDDFRQRTELLHADALAIEDVVGVKSFVEFEAVKNRGPDKELQKQSFDGTGIFDLLGIRWGVEVCADHDVGRLRRSPTGSWTWRPQIHVVVSCGARVRFENVVASKGGYVFHCDGEGASGAAQIHRPGVNEDGAFTRIVSTEDIDLSETQVPTEWNKLFATRGGISVYPPGRIPWADLG